MCRVSCDEIVPGTGGLSGCYYQLDSGFTALADCDGEGGSTPVTFDVFIYCDNDGNTKIKAGLGYSGGAFLHGDVWDGDFVLGGTSTLTLTSSDGFSGACTPPSTIELSTGGTCSTTPTPCAGCGGGGGGGAPLTMRPVPLDAKTGQPLSFIV